MIVYVACIGVVNADKSWSKVFVPTAFTDLTNMHTQIHTSQDAISPHFAMTVCESHFWCSLVCLKTAGEWLLTPFFISPLYKNTTQDARLCWTHVRKDLAFGKTITGSHSVRAPENLSKGFMSLLYNHCFDTRAAHRWLMIDLGSVVSVTSVLFHPVRGPQYINYGHDETILYSQIAPDQEGDFSNFLTLGTMKKATEPYVPMEFHAKKAIKARYISIVAEQPFEAVRLACFVQVF